MARVREDRMRRVRVRAGQIVWPELGKTACAGSACELARGRGLGDWLSLLEEWRFTVQDRIGLLILFPKKLDFINFPFRLLITLYF